ncbi:DMT family transporter [Pseudonocardia acaciae]|uniref:DMT family transporter n=1 Tax=Pseudonocardia acaciae TaxID=551276 RepID=UPI00048B2F30|nr:multidrug efflux SMR transporter [Pseudonocardia acaciae]
MTRWVYLGVAIGLEVLGTLSLRAMDGFAHPWWLLGVVVGYAGAFACVAQVLRAGMPVGVAYGIWAAVGVALTAVGGAVLFGDRLSWLIGAGIALVIGGVLAVELGARRSVR